MLSQGRSLSKPTGGKLNSSRKRKRFELGSDPTWTLLGPRRAALHRTRGGGARVRLLGADTVQAMDPKTGRTTPAKIVTVVANPANAFFQRRNILTRGAILQTDKGRVRVTNRPGQEGSVAGVLVEEAAAPAPKKDALNSP